MPHELTTSQEKLSFWSIIFSYSMQQQQTISCMMKSGFCTTTSDNQLSGWTKKKLQSTFQSLTCIRKMSWSLFGGLLPVWPTTTFQMPANCYLRDVCSANQWDAQKTQTAEPALGSRVDPTLQQHPTTHCITSASKPEWTGLGSFASSAIFTWPLTNWLALLQAPQHHFSRKKLSQRAGGRKCFPRVHWILKHRFLCYRNKLLSPWQQWLDCNGTNFD